MIKNKKRKILILTVKWGHLSIAKAIQSSLSRYNINAEVTQIDVEGLSEISYTAFYRLFPNLWKIPFKLSEFDQARKLAENYFHKSYGKKLEAVIAEKNPDIVISVYFGFNPTLDKLSAKSGFKLINMITNPRTFSRIELSLGSYDYLFDKKAVSRCRKLGLKKDKYVIGGWFVRSEFYEDYDKKDVRKKLGQPEDIFNICIIGGSEGNYGILKILPAFIGLSEKVQLVFICGNNKQLQKTVEGFAKIISMAENNNMQITILGYTQNVYKYMQAADLVLGKAGPNQLFETVSTQTPFFAVSHISGQEDGNLDIIKEYKLGFVEENPYKATRLLRNIIKNPGILKRFDKPLKKMAEYNSNESQVLQKLILEDLD
jgi:UDP-N-acetylglucosamine:LPS N-acetylglucosamine transferase